MDSDKVKKMLAELDQCGEGAYEAAREASATGEKAVEQAAMHRYGVYIRAEECLRTLAVEVQELLRERSTNVQQP